MVNELYFSSVEHARAQWNVILIHGMGANDIDMHNLSTSLNFASPVNWYFPRAPYQVGPENYGWFPRSEDKLSQLFEQPWHLIENRYDETIDIATDELIHLCQNILTLDPHKTIIGGFSQGAMLTSNLMLRTNTFLAQAYLLLSGALFNAEKLHHSTPSHLVPYFQSHGTEDTVLPFESAQRLHTLLQQKGFNKGSFHQYDNAAHEIPTECRMDIINFINAIMTHEQ